MRLFVRWDNWGWAEQLNKNVNITGAPAAPVIEHAEQPQVTVALNHYIEPPAVGIGETRHILVAIKNNTNSEVAGEVIIKIPEGWKVDIPGINIELAPGEDKKLAMKISAPANIPVLQERNICTVTFKAEGMEPITRVDVEREYMTLDELQNHGAPGDATKEGSTFNAYEDLFSVNDIIGFQGPCTVYAVRRMISPEDRIAGIQIDHTDAYKLWINGKLVSERDNVNWWTSENAHIKNFPIGKGINTIIVKLVRRSAKADFSMIFAKGGPYTEHYFDFTSVNPSSR